MAYHHHRPLTTMYGDNYRYGTSLYSPSVDDVEKKYRNTLSRTHLRSDRGDLGLYSFAGSNLHGGTPAAEKITAPKTRSSTTNDLYAPLNTGGYGSGYYDHLRATSPEPRTRSKPRLDLDEPVYTSRIRPDPYYQMDEPDYHTRPGRVQTEFSYDSGNEGLGKTTTKKTTTTTEWVPLTTYIYNSPYHSYYYRSSPHSSYTYRTADDLYSYNYVDDFKRSATTTTKSKNLDALDLSITSKNYDRMDYNRYSEKCRDIQCQLDEVNKCLYEAETKLKTDVVNSRDKIQADLTDVAMIVEDTAKYNDDLHRVIKKQAKQISALSTQYEDINRNLSDISETFEKSRLRSQTIQSELSTVQSGLELTLKRRF